MGNVINQPLDEVLVHFEKIFSEPARSKRFSRALISTDPQADFLMKHWQRERDKIFEELYNFFQNVAHHNQSPTLAALKEKLRLFESLLLNYLTPCTAAQQKELLTLMALPASDQTFTRVSELILHKTANLHFFFDKLENPDWISFLDRKGLFQNLPEPEPTNDGRIMYRHHLPLVVLTRLAGSAPQAVTRVLVKLRLPENPCVGDQILQCITKISDPDCVKELHPLIAQFGESPARTSWLWIQELLNSWLELKAFPEIFAVLGAYLNSALNMPGHENYNVHGTWLLKEIDKKFLDTLTVQSPTSVVRVVFAALSKWAEQESKELEPGSADSGLRFYLIEDFKGTPPEHRGIEATLAKRLFSAAQQIYVQGDTTTIAEIDNLLRLNSSHLFRRLRWQLYADFPNLTLASARADVLRRIPFLNRIDYNCGSHDYEFAQLLVSHVRHHGDAFLSASEVEEFATTVLTGPLDRQGKLLEGDNDFFYRKQLWPIAPLLRAEKLAAYRALVPDDTKINIESFKPFRSGGISGGFVASEAPPEAEALDSMSDEQLWRFLNNWQPAARYPTSEGWVQQDIFALGSKFAASVEKSPERFSPKTQWWKNVCRLEILSKILDRAADRLAQTQKADKGPIDLPTEADWANWLGVTKWIISQTWSCEAVARFLGKALASDHSIPEYYSSELPELLSRLVGEVDSRLDSGGNSFNDWLTTAINSIRGESVEALLNLARRQKNAGRDIEPWIFELLRSRLELPQESPAIFALLGAKLRFCVHLFKQQLAGSPDLLFPRTKPEHRSASIIAHFNYDHPWNAIIETFPKFIDTALDTLQTMRVEDNDENAQQNRRDFASQLGTHIACYYWSGSFKDDTEGEAALDRFFDVASKGARAMLISQISQIWEKPGNELPDVKTITKVLHIWERRYAQVERYLCKEKSVINLYEDELGASISWLHCECFPFEWRFNYSKLALQRLRKAPSAYRLLEAIVQFSRQNDRLRPMLELLKGLLSKPSDELRWSIQPAKLEPMISLGLASDSAVTGKLAEDCKDLLLKMGFSDFLKL